MLHGTHKKKGSTKAKRKKNIAEASNQLRLRKPTVLQYLNQPKFKAKKMKKRGTIGKDQGKKTIIKDKRAKRHKTSHKLKS